MWLSATFGMVAKELLVIKLNLILPTFANTWVGKEDIHSNLKPYLFRKMLKVVPKSWNPFKTHVDESRYKVELFAEFYLSCCLTVLTSGSGFFLEGRLEPNHHTRISEYMKETYSFWRAFLRGADEFIPCFFSRFWFFNFLVTEIGKKMFHLSECHWLYFHKLTGVS